MGDKKLVVKKRNEKFQFYLPKDDGKNLDQEIDSIIKHNEFLAERTIIKRD